MKTYQSSLLKPYPNLLSIFTTKKDGNLAFHVNDNRIDVVQNHKRLANLHLFSSEKLIFMKQIHSNKVHIVEENDNFNSLPTCDALITNKKNTPLMVMVADCTPVLFYDPIKQVIAVAHAGREGTFLNIVQNVLDSFTKTYHSKNKDILVSLGISICQNCYEIGEEIVQKATQLNYTYALKQKNDKYYLDIKAILKQQLLDAGILEDKIEISLKCSSCDVKEYFSYRKEGQTGRFAGVLMLK